MEKIWGLTCTELYHSEPMKKLYEKFAGEAIGFWRSSFSIVMERGLIEMIKA